MDEFNKEFIGKNDSAEEEYTIIPESEETQENDNLFYDDEPQETAEENIVTEETVYYSAQPIRPQNSNKKGRFSLGSLLLCSIASALVATIVAATVSSVFILNKVDNNVENSGVIENNQTNNQENNQSDSTTTIEITGVTESVIEAVAQKVNPSVVGIATTEASASFFGGSNETTGEGSGIIYTSNGYIITNYHVIESAVTSANTGIEVYLSTDTKKSYEATVVGYNISYDLAVIKIDANSLAPINFSDSSELKVGQYVAAVGSPGGLQFMGSVTYGIISGLNRVVSDSSSNSSVELIQTDAAINPGNSGGALVNTKGELVGVNSSKIAATAYEGMGFAIPSNTVKEICDNIIAKENDPNPYIGITISERYTAEVLTQLGYPAGAVVKSVISAGPAEKAGIRSGDIIVEFNSVKITQYDVLTETIGNCKPGDTVAVKIYRSGRYYSTSLKVGSNNSQ